MNEVTADFWKLYEQKQSNDVFIIPTNGSWNAKEEAVMGRGLALDAKKRFSELPGQLGQLLINRGNRLYYFPEYQIVTFPVKIQWHENAKIILIRRSAEQLNMLLHAVVGMHAYVPRVGCGNGKLRWRDVEPVLRSAFYAPDRFGSRYTIVSPK